jgi:poly-gamma-glutamate synthesis protein (capsule biosynthesis protein)
MKFSHFPKVFNWIIPALVLAAGLFLFPLIDADKSIRQFMFALIREKKTVEVLPLAPIIVPPEIRFMFFGDLMLDRSVAQKLKNKNLDFILADLASSTNLSSFDLVGANLEGALTNGGEHYAPEMLYDFAFSPERVQELKQYNFSYFTIANNHFADQGDQGIRETRENLEHLGFFYSGEKDAQISENSLRYVSIKDKKIALLAFSMVYHNFDLEKAKKMISAAREQADWVIINIHWGNEYQHNYNVTQQNIGHEFILSGADVIIGHHSHVVQGVEIYQNRPIFYSLGNFIFDQYFSEDTQTGLGLKIILNENKLTITLLPLRSSRSVVNLMSELERQKFLENFALWSKAELDLKNQILAQTISIAK